jgi:hypothetical protein
VRGMAQREKLLTISYISDDDCGMYSIGGIGYGVHGTLKDYLKRYGAEGMKDILCALGHLTYEVKKSFYENCP